MTPPPNISSNASSNKYVVASHSVRITKQGYAVDPVALRYTEIVSKLSDESRRLSNVSFDPSSIGNKILDMIRSFWSQPTFPDNRFVKPPYEKKAQLVDRLLKKMEEIFSKELRILQVAAPCTVLGDIHGNLTDLRSYERSLWPKAPNCVTSNYLFLGDYVDRGDHGVECVLYLFAMKLVAPTRFFMLRGNHEVAAIQRQYTFSRECEVKFGPFGRDLWLSFNKVFDLMPLAAIVDKQIFCAHGGIPRSVSNVQTLTSEIPTPLDNPESQCPAAWEILWNDPITDNELVGLIEMDTTFAKPASRIDAPESGANQDVVPESTPSQQTRSSSEQQSSKGQTDRVPGEPSPKIAPNTDKTDQPTQIQPAEKSVLSSFIRPGKDPSEATQETPTNDSLSERKSDKNQAKDALKSKAKDNDDTLRTVPSETSSIASTSPQQMMNDGFVPNIKRGTAYLFSDQAIASFLELNKLSHVIRAHEVIPTGFSFHGDGRVITIFSSSKYCGLNNQAACALIERNRIRILRLDTGADID